MSNVTSLVVARIKAKAKVLGLNEYQLETILEGGPAWANIFLDDVKVPDYRSALDKVIIPYNSMKLDYDIIKRIDAGKHTVMCVAGEEGFAYTIGLTNNRPNPHELFISVGIGTTAQSMLNEIADKYPDGNYPTAPFELKSCFVKKGNLKLNSRVRIFKSTDPQKIIEANFRRIDQWTGILPSDIYVVHVSDPNNILPGEAGYDITFCQYRELPNAKLIMNGWVENLTRLKWIIFNLTEDNPGSDIIYNAVPLEIEGVDMEDNVCLFELRSDTIDLDKVTKYLDESDLGLMDRTFKLGPLQQRLQLPEKDSPVKVFHCRAEYFGDAEKLQAQFAANNVVADFTFEPFISNRGDMLPDYFIQIKGGQLTKELIQSLIESIDDSHVMLRTLAEGPIYDNKSKIGKIVS